MLKPEDFYQSLLDNNINFFTGVPDSLLKNFCAYLQDNTDRKKHIITANEGSAIALAAGVNISTGSLPLVYMQNSGLGNAVNPLSSLASNEVYSIPMMLCIGWRGEPDKKDEPQHMMKGKITCSLLETLNIPYEVLSNDLAKAKEQIALLKGKAYEVSGPVALVVKADTFESYKLINNTNDISEISREDAISVVLDKFKDKALYVGNTGKIGRELYDSRRHLEIEKNCDFLNVGAMGHTSMLALGIALNTDKKVICLDGDGSILMHTGNLSNIGSCNLNNYIHIALNNAAHDSVGGQPTLAAQISLEGLSKEMGYSNHATVDNIIDLENALENLEAGATFIEVKVKKGARKDLSRPKESFEALKELFKENINA